MKVITADKVIQDNFAMLLEITDEQLEEIRNSPSRLASLDYMQELMKSKGNNAHILQLTINDGYSIIDYLEVLFKKYDSVSWFNREHKFHIRRAKCHQYSQLYQQ